MISAAASTAVPQTVAAQATINAQCVAGAGPSCSLLRFLISSGADPVAISVFRASLSPASGWLFTGGPTGSFVAEDGFSFGVPFSGSTEIGNNGLDLLISFVYGPMYELFPYSFGYIEVGVSGQGTTTFAYDFDDPDQLVTSGAGNVAPLPDPTVVPEPVTMVLLGSGLAGIAGVRRRRRRTPGSS